MQFITKEQREQMTVEEAEVLYNLGIVSVCHDGEIVKFERERE